MGCICDQNTTPPQKDSNTLTTTTANQVEIIKYTSVTALMALLLGSSKAFNAILYVLFSKHWL